MELFFFFFNVQLGSRSGNIFKKTHSILYCTVQEGLPNSSATYHPLKVLTNTYIQQLFTEIIYSNSTSLNDLKLSWYVYKS